MCSMGQWQSDSEQNLVQVATLPPNNQIIYPDYKNFINYDIDLLSAAMREQALTEL